VKLRYTLPALADLEQQQVAQGLNVGLNPPRSLRRMSVNVIENRAWHIFFRKPLESNTFRYI